MGGDPITTYVRPGMTQGCVDPNLEGKLLENAYPIFVLSERWLEKKHDKRQWNR